jgi:hypothetical protein
MEEFRGVSGTGRALVFWALSSVFIAMPITLVAQVRSTGEFQLTKITKNLITSPQYSFTGAQQYQSDQRDRWLEVEVEFTSARDLTDEVICKYFILFNGKLLTGDVTHTNVPSGRELRSVMYVAPRTLLRFAGNRTINANIIQNIAVQIVQQGAIKDEMNLVRAPAQWYAALPALSGFVLNKNETPFAPLYWDRYEQIKSSVH